MGNNVSREAIEDISYVSTRRYFKFTGRKSTSARILFVDQDILLLEMSFLSIVRCGSPLCYYFNRFVQNLLQRGACAWTIVDAHSSLGYFRIFSSTSMLVPVDSTTFFSIVHLFLMKITMNLNNLTEISSVIQRYYFPRPELSSSNIDLAIKYHWLYSNSKLNKTEALRRDLSKLIIVTTFHRLERLIYHWILSVNARTLF